MKCVLTMKEINSVKKMIWRRGVLCSCKPLSLIEERIGEKISKQLSVKAMDLISPRLPAENPFGRRSR